MYGLCLLPAKATMAGRTARQQGSSQSNTHACNPADIGGGMHNVCNFHNHTTTRNATITTTDGQELLQVQNSSAAQISRQASWGNLIHTKLSQTGQALYTPCTRNSKVHETTPQIYIDSRPRRSRRRNAPPYVLAALYHKPILSACLFAAHRISFAGKT
jgi:hypothetical protein